jgi:hypothetical protein
MSRGVLLKEGESWRVIVHIHLNLTLNGDRRASSGQYIGAERFIKETGGPGTDCFLQLSKKQVVFMR